jgi:ABC-type cobalamin transport system permease subunit
VLNLPRADSGELLVHTRHLPRPVDVALLGAVLSLSTATALAPATTAPPAITLVIDTAPVRLAGMLTGSTTLVCLYTVLGSGAVTVPGVVSFSTSPWALGAGLRHYANS